jgi:outer membrane protein with beta-barrel domain
MRRFVSGIVVVLVVALATARVVHAQGAEFSLGGGVDLPLSNFDDAFKTGFHGLAGVSVIPSGWPVGIQVDGTYSQYSDDSPADIKEQLIYGTANIVYKFKTSEESRFRPYLIGGGGVYNAKLKGDDVPTGFDNSETKFGINVGAGFDIKAGAVGLFAEGRFHDVFISDVPNLKFIPITVGIRFGGA